MAQRSVTTMIQAHVLFNNTVNRWDFTVQASNSAQQVTNVSYTPFSYAFNSGTKTVNEWTNYII